MSEDKKPYKIWHASGNTPLKDDPTKFAHHFTGIILIADNIDTIKKLEDKFEEFVKEVGAKTRISDFSTKELKRPW